MLVIRVEIAADCLAVPQPTIRKPAWHMWSLLAPAPAVCRRPMIYVSRWASSTKNTVISNSDAFLFVPPNPWVAVGWRSRQDSTFELAPYLSKKNIAFIPMAAQGIKPDDNQVILVDGRVVDYEYLVIATGPKLAFEEVDGLGPRGYTHSVCTLTMRKRPLPPGRNSSRTRVTSGRRSTDGLLFRTGL